MGGFVLWQIKSRSRHAQRPRNHLCKPDMTQHDCLGKTAGILKIRGRRVLFLKSLLSVMLVILPNSDLFHYSKVTPKAQCSRPNADMLPPCLTVCFRCLSWREHIRHCPAGLWLIYSTPASECRCRGDCGSNLRNRGRSRRRTRPGSRSRTYRSCSSRDGATPCPETRPS